MMIPIKIECECGQHYAFDVQAGTARLPAPVACPACGADGTAAANAIITQHSPPAEKVTLAPANPVRLNITHPAPAAPAAPRRKALLPGQVERPQAEIEAKAKIFWGDTQEEVIKYLMIQNFTYEEASDLVGEMYRERQVALRGIAVRNLVTGIGLILVPVVTFIIFAIIGYLPLKIFGLTVAVGLFGVWLCIKGGMTLLAPRSESGDVADQ